MPSVKIREQPRGRLQFKIHIRGETVGDKVKVHITHLRGSGETGRAVVARQVHEQVDIAHGDRAQGRHIPLVVGK